MIKEKLQRLALDKGSVRTIDKDGRLHIAVTPISKANICPYHGKEIPESEALGLEDDKVYFLLRDPEELAKAASTFNNLPLLEIHIPVSAQDPQREMTVGTTGTDAQFKDGYLFNSLAVWDGAAIEGIQGEWKRELSACYHYDADMTPGTFDGKKYDGVMRNIVGNHVALVEVGRAGPDVLAADSHTQLLEPSTMKLSPTANALRGGLKVYLRPKLASDASTGDLRSLVAHVTATNFDKQKPALVNSIKKRFGHKLAQDANMDDLAKLLEMFCSEKDDMTQDDDMDDDSDTSMDDASESEPAATAAEPEDKDAKVAKAMAALSGLMSDDDLAKVKAMMSGTAMDEKDEAAPPFTKDTPKPPSKAAMDAAIAEAKSSTMKQLIAIDEAERIVKPFIGEVTRQESAAAVYKLALDAASVDLKDVHPSAYKPIVQNLPLPGSANTSSRMATDSSATSSFMKRFPTAVLPARR